jgi:hypothetical protein
MATLYESARTSDVILWEAGEEVNYTRANGTLASGTVASVTGQVLGQITLGTPTAAAKDGGNTGNGTCTALSNSATAKLGAYTLTFTSATAFTVTDPNGDSLPNGVNGAYVSGQVNFTITAGGAAFVAGDGFVITVVAGSGKYVQVAPAAVDGSQNAAGVLLTPNTATLVADASVAVLVRGPAILKASGIAYTSGMTTPQKATAAAQLAALGITVRTDYGV